MFRRKTLLRDIWLASISSLTTWCWVAVAQSRPLAMIGDLTLHPPFVALLAYLVTGLVVVTIVTIVRAPLWALWARQPRQRFAALAPTVNGLVSSFDKHGTFTYADTVTLATLHQELMRLHIDCPPIHDEMIWKVWLRYLTAFVRTKNLTEARRIARALCQKLNNNAEDGS